jgi:uncharacterized protein (DUF433 family)
MNAIPTPGVSYIPPSCRAWPEHFIYSCPQFDYFANMDTGKSNKIIIRNKDILGGTPVFKGTRVPVSTLWDYLKAGDTVQDFLDDFPSVKKDQVILLLERAENRVLNVQ